ATKEYRRRVIQLGEAPCSVFHVGALGLDGIRELKPFTRNQLEQELGIKFDRRNLLVTFHPATAEKNTGAVQFRNLLAVLEELKQTQLIFTKSNADSGGREINCLIDQYARKNSWRTIAFASLGQIRYWSLMKQVDAVVGNSSSGIIEAPSFKIGTIDIGDRQKGRVQAQSVIHCNPSRSDMRKALKLLYSGRFQEQLRAVTNPYGDGKTAKRIKSVFKRTNYQNLIPKKFFDIPAFEVRL
ncbi:MAG: UDP-N-acetylglucosamine 2-epimerase, partial [Candidatus Omnitrophica bacterium]|nr:UDP-N-acetylglucosamine 2-epimerase [Candidatus Omnitrophota bacterium]